MSGEVNTSKTSSFNEDEQHVAGNAYNCFNASQYDASLSILKKLQKTHSHDIRLMHNRALAEFCKSGKTKVTDLRKIFGKIHRMLQQSSKEDEDISGLNEKSRYKFFYYNQALLLYNTHQYSESGSVLEKLYESCDSHDEKFSLKLFLLHIDASLATYNAKEAAHLVSNLETHYFGENSSKAEGKTLATEALRVYLKYLKMCGLLQMKSIKACKRELKTFTTIQPNSSNSKQNSIIEVASVFLKSNLEYVRSNYHKAYKLLASFTLPPSSGTINTFNENLGTMYFNNLGVIHFSMKKYCLAAYYSQKALQENDSAISSAMKQQQSNKHQQQQTNSNTKHLSVLNMNKRYELLYNCGIQLLFAGHPSIAFDHLISALPAFPNNPRLWLRIAECCIQQKTTREESDDVKRKMYNHSYNILGNGVHRKVIINSISQSLGVKSNTTVMPAQTLEFASVCLKNSLTILQKAMKGPGLEVDENQSEGEGKGKEESKFVPLVACLPGAYACGAALTQLHASVLANSAFVALHTGDKLNALHYSQALLGIPKISGAHRYLGNMYAAEALVSLDRISESIQHLSVERVKNINVQYEDNGKKSPVNDEQKQASNNWETNKYNSSNQLPSCQYPSNLKTAHLYMTINLATAHCLRSEHEKAQRLLVSSNYLSVKSNHLPPQALVLAVYLHLNCGETAAALKVIKNKFPLRQEVVKSQTNRHSNNEVSRSKSNTPQPNQGGGKSKNSEGKGKRNRR